MRSARPCQRCLKTTVSNLHRQIGLIAATLKIWVLCLCVALVIMPAGGFAQTEPAPLVDADGRPLYEDWDRVAIRAQEVIDANLASDQAVTTLRGLLARWRTVFERRQSVNSAQIDTVRSQITALGAVPEDGTPEAAEIATRRTTLNTQLTELLAPGLRAEEAFKQVDGLIGQVDSLIRTRQADRRLRLDPTPLNPVNWSSGVAVLTQTASTLRAEFNRNYESEAQQKGLRDNLPLIIILVILGLVLVTRAGAWVERFIRSARARKEEARAGFRVATFLGSMLALGLPVLGIIMIIEAADMSGMTGVTGDQLLLILSMAIVTVAIARWLSVQIMPISEVKNPLLSVTRLQGREARLYAVAASVVMSLSFGLSQLASDSLILRQTFDLTAQAVLQFPLIVIAGVFLFRLGQILVAASKARAREVEAAAAASGDASAGPSEEAPARMILTFLGRASYIVGIVGPILAGIGYIAAGADLVFSTILTLGLVAFVAVLQRFAKDIYAIFTRDETSGTALIPVLISFSIAILSLPFLALIWGAQVSDLSEAWALVASGFQIGESRISPTDFLIFVLVFVVGYTLTRLLQGTLKTQVLPNTRLDAGGRNAIVAGTGYIGIFLAAVAAITAAGLDLSSLAIVAGALSVGIGFGLQTIVSNFVSGIILLIERPISEGDWIEVGSTMGVVRDISVRATRIETFDRTDVIVPNADLIANSVTNWTKGNLNGRIILKVGVAYGSDTQKVQALLQEIAAAHPLVIINPPPAVHFVNFGGDSLDFEIRAILRDVNYMLTARSEINHEIAKRFVEEKIEIPFAQRDLWLRNPEAFPGVSEEGSS